MPEKTLQLAELAKIALESTAESDDLLPFLNRLLPEMRGAAGAKIVGVVRTNPPQWEAVAASGAPAKLLPTEAAAEAIDLNRPSAVGDWLAAPLGEGYALTAAGTTPVVFAELADILQPALQTVHNRAQRQRRIRRLERLLDITRRWGQAECTESLLKAMAETAADLLGAERASIFLWDKTNRQLIARPALGVEDDELRIPDNAGVAGQVVQTLQPRRVGGGLGENEIDRTVDKSTGYTTRNLICVPLLTPADRCLGAFEVLNKREGHFSDEDERGLVELAAYAAVALENTQHFEELLTKHQKLVEQAAEGVQLIGHSPAIEAVRSTVRRIADTDLAILILGENGTGKEVVARSIHYLSRRRDQPFIAVNCAAIAETLLESELFGHEKGAFTDARESRPGKFELASGGTLFLDEIGDMSPGGQAKLLRVLEDKIVVRVGGSRPIHTEVRILAATNQDLGAMVRQKRFREDLFFRLNVVSLELPALRERGEDVLLLAEFFLRSFCVGMGRRMPSFSAAARRRLAQHAWPGNVRELRNVCERLAYLSSGEVVELDDLAFLDPGLQESGPAVDLDATLAEATRQFQDRFIRQTIEAQRGNMTTAAQRLGLHRSNLYRKMRQLGMPTGDEE
ncbi:MAG: sigma-54-dependent Fis family transcriptional regulator [Pirellulales bacterium]|nr:sigma-54-dependent Fis family transcriptional regulator [Pirellulales bacterium]